MVPYRPPAYPAGEDSVPAPRNRPALAIYRPVPSTPLETDGTGLRPVVRAKLSVDARGKVTGVGILSIEPSSRYDSHFRRAAKNGLRLWRFRPELREGRPVAAEVPVTLRFEPRSWHGGTGLYPSLGLLLADTQRETHRRRLLSLPEEQKERIREALSEKAEGLLAAGRRFEAGSERFDVVTDSSEVAARSLLSNLEAAWATGIGILSRQVPMQPSRGKIKAYIFTSAASYQALVSSIDAFEWTAGLYHAAGFLAFHLQWPSPEIVLATLVHEATHALMDRHVVRPGILLPRWIDEGFATYMELSRIEDGKLVPGALDRRTRGLKFVPPADPEGAADESGDRAKSPGKEGPFTLAQLAESSTVTFYGERRDRYYLDSWKAVHFLMHGGEDWATERFPLLILYLAEGYDFARSVQRVFGKPLEDLQPEFERHAARL